MFNKIILIGRWTENPQIRYTPGGKAIANCKLACDTTYGENKKDTLFIKVAVWGKRGEATAQHTYKGYLVMVSGRLRNANYTDSQGNKKYDMELVAEDVKFLAPPRNGRADAGGEGSEYNDEFSEVPFTDSDDLPF